MIYADITDDGKFLTLTGMTMTELKQLQISFTKELDDAWLIKKKTPWAAFETKFMNDYGMIPAGLWLELVKISRRWSLPLDFSPKAVSMLVDQSVSEQVFKNYCSMLFEDARDGEGHPVTLRDYQIDGVFNLIKYRKACLEITTSGGKTLMAYILFRFLRDVMNVKRLLYIVPNKNLATQSAEAFDKYEKWTHSDHSWTSVALASDTKKKDRKFSSECTVLFATFQTLNNKDMQFFQSFDAVFVDECHHAQANSIKKILTMCTGASYVFGMTGTFPKEDSHDRFLIESFIGPHVFTLESFQLIQEIGGACPVVVVEELLDWASTDDKKALYEIRKTAAGQDLGTKLLRQEQDFVNGNLDRLYYICNQAIKAKGNCMILFGDVNIGKYGHKVCEYIKDNSEKNVYYADGSTPVRNREIYNDLLENDTSGNTVIVASIYTYGEGIDLHNLYSIFLVNSLKSEKQLRQILGRGMRLYTNPETGEEKKMVVLFDFVDDLRYGKKDDSPWRINNYLWRHHEERHQIYVDHKFPVYQREVKLGYQAAKSVKGIDMS